MTKYVDTQAVEAICEKNWANSAAIRTEFAGNKGAYKAYWCAVARGQTPPPRVPKAAQPVSSASIAPAVATPVATNRPAVAASAAQGQASRVGDHYSVLSRVRAFYAVDPVEAKKQYPQQVKQIEEAKVQGHV
jgi:hypothetical protein